MLLTDYLLSIVGTEEEQVFLRELSKLKDDFAEVTTVPVVGDLFAALVALCDGGNLETFAQTPHFASLEGFNITVKDLEKGHFSIYPGTAMLKKAALFLGAVFAGILLLCAIVKRCRR